MLYPKSSKPTSLRADTVAFRVSEPSATFKKHWELWKKTKKDYTSPVAADLFYKRLFKANFLVLKNNFRVSTLTLYREKAPVIIACHYLPQGSWPGPECIGAFAIHPDVTDEEIKNFWAHVRKWTKGRPVTAPLNGHHYLGVALPEAQANPKKIGIFNPASSPSSQKLFGFTDKIYRTYLAFETEITEKLKHRLISESQDLPEGFSVRPFSKLHYRRDLKIFNQLVNQCFTEHFDFCPLSDEENHDIMAMLVPLFQKGHFNFLEHRGQAIGFCMGMKDYHQIWDNRSDARNITALLYHKNKLRRARIIHIGIHPNYRGQKLVKYLRHKTLLNLIEDGIQTVENSYIDEGNRASIANVRSTQGQMLNEFHTFRI